MGAVWCLQRFPAPSREGPNASSHTGREDAGNRASGRAFKTCMRLHTVGPVSQMRERGSIRLLYQTLSIDRLIVKIPFRAQTRKFQRVDPNEAMVLARLVRREARRDQRSLVCSSDVTIMLCLGSSRIGTRRAAPVSVGLKPEGDGATDGEDDLRRQDFGSGANSWEHTRGRGT